MVGRLHLERIFVGNHIADKFHSRITATLIPLATTGSHDDILQAIYIRFQFHLDILALLTCTQSEFLRLVSHHLEMDGNIACRITQ